MSISSLQVEKHVLSGLIRFPDLFVDVAPFLKEVDFFDSIHKTIFLVMKSIAEKGDKWDKVLLAEKIRNIGVSFKGDINIYDYIENLSFITITKPATVQAARELIKIRVRRDYVSMAEEISQFVASNGNLSVEDIISGVDSIFGRKIDIVEEGSQPENLYEGIETMVEERGKNPVEETGLKTPYPEFNRMYGGLKPRHVYAFASRPGQGKSTLLEDLAVKCSQLNGTCAFVCDTEMSTEEIRWRSVAARSTVPQWYLETGNFRKNADMTEKVRSSYKQLKDYAEKKLVTHFHVADKNLDQVISMIRRWYAARVKKGTVGIIVYDYLKLTVGENVSENWAEYQVMGQKINRLKRLAEELNCVILTAIQLNRSGEKRGANGIVDDSSAISISDRLQWLAALVAIFRRKTLDEINVDGESFGTHKMIVLKSRFQGRDAAGHHDRVRRMNNEGEMEWVDNYLNFRVHNFDIVEAGSLRDIVAAERLQCPPTDQNPTDGEEPL